MSYWKLDISRVVHSVDQGQCVIEDLLRDMVERGMQAALVELLSWGAAEFRVCATDEEIELLQQLAINAIGRAMVGIERADEMECDDAT